LHRVQAPALAGSKSLGISFSYTIVSLPNMPSVYKQIEIFEELEREVGEIHSSWVPQGHKYVYFDI
jgi:hypothetical protein